MAPRLFALLLLSAVAFSLIAAVGCTEKVNLPTESPLPGGAPVTPDTIQVIFDTRCISCHSGSSPAGGMDLSADHSYANTVNVPSGACSPLDRIEPNDPANSCLVQRIEGTVAPRMPLGSINPLPADQITRIKSWIAQGAPGTPISGPPL